MGVDDAETTSLSFGLATQVDKSPARCAVALPPVTPAADQHHAATALAAVQTKRTELHANPTACMTGASAAALAVAV